MYGDTAPLSDETPFANLSSLTTATVARGQGVGKILNDDTPLQTSSVTPTEGISGTKIANIPVSQPRHMPHWSAPQP